jgi:hypothetical protein
LREVIPWTLLLCAVTTFLLLLERRRKSRLNLLDEWAGKSGLQLESDVGAGALAPLEPLTLVAPVVDVERMWHGRMSVAAVPRPIEAWLLSCLAGTQHRPRRMLLGIFEAPPELPQLRVLPSADAAAPDNLGFVTQNTAELPPSYRLEAFSAPPQPVVEALGESLREASGKDFRIELRPDRLLVALPAEDARDADLLLRLALPLLARLAVPDREQRPYLLH